MKVGDLVRMAPMWKYPEAHGKIIKISSTYIIVSWDSIPGEWHYTQQQSSRLEVIK